MCLENPMKTLAALILCTCMFPKAAAQQQSADSPAFHFQPGQSVYVIAVDLWGDLGHSKPNLELERNTIEQFRKEKKFAVTLIKEKADFLFIIALDPTSQALDEVAL